MGFLRERRLRRFLVINSRGMEMWQIVLIDLALFLLFFMFIWSGSLGEKMSSILGSFKEMF